ncbi:MAG: hypothetical protein PHU25_09730 [Deltaproteobacteria bacterium]|nr:hypothetical protein [Deltaproteobacteria bacterium]
MTGRFPPRFWLRVALSVLGLAIVFGVYGRFVAQDLDGTALNADEGYYAVAARSVLEGKMPYRDFGYTQMPLLPYVNGLAMRVVGFGVLEQRAVNATWAGLGLLALILALRQRLGRLEPGIVAAFTVAASPNWIAFQTIGKSYGAAGFFLACSAAAVLVRGPVLARAGALAVAATLAVGCRLSSGPVVVLLGAALFFEARGWREKLIAAGLPIGVGVLSLAPFVLAAPENALFYTWSFHMESTMVRRSLAQALEWWKTAPAAILVLATGLFGLPLLVRRRMWTEALFLLAAVAGLALPMVPTSAYGEYVTPALPLASSAGMLAFWSTGEAQGNPFRHVAWILPALVLFHPLPESAPGRTSSSMRDVAKYLREEVPKGPILTPLPMVAVEAGRPVIAGTEMGMFAAMGPQDRDLARRLKLTTILDLVRIVEARQPVAVVKLSGSSVWNFRWQVPTLHRQPNGVYARFKQALAKNYELDHRAGNLEILVPREH